MTLAGLPIRFRMDLSTMSFRSEASTDTCRNFDSVSIAFSFMPHHLLLLSLNTSTPVQCLSGVHLYSRTQKMMQH